MVSIGRHGAWAVQPSPAHTATHTEPPFVGCVKPVFLFSGGAKIIPNEPHFQFHKKIKAIELIWKCLYYMKKY